jgi:rubrerythrin
MGTVLDRIRTMFDDEGATERPETERTVSSTLYRCRGCETTYVDTEMESCSSCGDPVEEIPSESDLGFGPTGV